ncbi:MAG: PorT family protein [Melioribacteraceae bacterium]|nr:PorT family protein [Melioribacteraceae bacterium]
MKKVFVVGMLLLITLNLSPLYAQNNVTFGFNGGVNLANVSGDDVDDADSKYGFSAGAFLNVKLSRVFSLRPEIYYASKGFSLEENEYYADADYSYDLSAESEISLNYLEVPILGVISINKNMNLFAGPYVDYFLSGDAEVETKGTVRYCSWGKCTTESINESETEDIDSDNMSSPGFGLIVGGEFVMGQFKIGARYSLGLSNISDNDESDFSHNVIQVMVGVSL